MPTKYGEFRAYGYLNLLNGEHHVALVKGDIGDGEDVLCRVHLECLTGRCIWFPAVRLRTAACVGDDTGLRRRDEAFSSICGRRDEASDF